MEESTQKLGLLNLPLYQYEPLKSIDAVRVVVLEAAETFTSILRCSFIQYSRSKYLAKADNSRHYSAVSYAWGAPDFSRVLICASNNPEKPADSRLNITPTVETFLRHLRKAHKPVYLWVDALCLNQQDGVEKGQQVPLMGEIYTAAKKVHIWLGEDEGDAAATFALVRRLNTIYKLASEESVSIAAFLQKPWFGRRWIIQEVALARRATFFWGRASLDLSWLMSTLPRIQEDPLLGSGLYGSRMLLIVVATPGRHRDMLSLLWHLDRSECGDLRDRVASLIGLVPPEQRVQLNYDTDDWKTIYCRGAAQLINQTTGSAQLTMLHRFEFGSIEGGSDNEQRYPS